MVETVLNNSKGHPWCCSYGGPMLRILLTKLISCKNLNQLIRVESQFHFKIKRSIVTNLYLFPILLYIIYGS